MKAIIALLALILLTGCQSLYYAGLTKVKWETSDGVKILYVSGKDLQGIDVSRSCDPAGVCTVEIKVQDAQGSEAIKANAQALRDLIEASKDYAKLGKALGGMP